MGNWGNVTFGFDLNVYDAQFPFLLVQFFGLTGMEIWFVVPQSASETGTGLKGIFRSLKDYA